MPQEPQNPIVALATKIRARANIEQTIAPADSAAVIGPTMDTEAQLTAFGAGLQEGARLLNSILGRANGVTFIRLEKPLRLRLRFRDKRVTLDLDAERQLVIVGGSGFEGEYQFAETAVPAMINLSKLSTSEGYREPMTPSAMLKRLTEEAELPRPAHLDEGPLQF